VQVALESAALGIACGHDPLPRCAQLRQPGVRLHAQLFVVPAQLLVRHAQLVVLQRERARSANRVDGLGAD
jgi:hypothetical protein